MIVWNIYPYQMKVANKFLCKIYAHDNQATSFLYALFFHLLLNYTEPLSYMLSKERGKSSQTPS